MLKTATKQASVYLLLLLAALPLVYILVTRIQQQTIRNRMKERLEAQVLHKVSIPADKIHWIKQGKEIMLNGRMFDIRSVKFQSGEYVISGLYDEEETVLLAQLQKDQQNNTDHSKQLIQIFQLLQTIYHDPQEEFVLPVNETGSLFITVTTPLSSQFISIFTPPPQA